MDLYLPLGQWLNAEVRCAYVRMRISALGCLIEWDLSQPLAWGSLLTRHAVTQSLHASVPELNLKQVQHRFTKHTWIAMAVYSRSYTWDNNSMWGCCFFPHKVLKIDPASEVRLLCPVCNHQNITVEKPLEIRDLPPVEKLWSRNGVTGWLMLVIWLHQASLDTTVTPRWARRHLLRLLGNGRFDWGGRRHQNPA